MYHEITCTSSYTFLPARINFFKINNGSMLEICSKFTRKTPEWRQCHSAGNFVLHIFYTLYIVAFQQIRFVIYF